jgi:hypothetical protein
MPYPHDEQATVCQKQVEGRLAQLAVELQRTVVADGAVNERNPCSQEEHEQDQVHARKPGHDSRRREQ